MSQPACKPNSVSPPPRLAARRRGDNHSSRPAITHRLKRPTRWPFASARAMANRHSPGDGGTDGPSVERRHRIRGDVLTPPYLALLRAGFCLPPTLPPARCALTAPFHHCLPMRPCGRIEVGCVFSVPLSVRSPCPGVTRRTALRSSDFPLASALRTAASEPAVIRVRTPAVVRLAATALF